MEMYEHTLSIIATNALLLKHLVISIHSAD